MPSPTSSVWPAGAASRTAPPAARPSIRRSRRHHTPTASRAIQVRYTATRSPSPAVDTRRHRRLGGAVRAPQGQRQRRDGGGHRGRRDSPPRAFRAPLAAAQMRRAISTARAGRVIVSAHPRCRRRPALGAIAEQPAPGQLGEDVARLAPGRVPDRQRSIPIAQRECLLSAADRRGRAVCAQSRQSPQRYSRTRAWTSPAAAPTTPSCQNCGSAVQGERRRAQRRINL
jgi:hypothetical protein